MTTHPANPFHNNAMSAKNSLSLQNQCSTIGPNPWFRLVGNLAGSLVILAWFAASAHGAWDIWPFNKDDKPGKPEKVIVMWSDTVLSRSDRPPMRGFGGRLMFYEKDKEEAIKVEGNLVVYAFDESAHPEDNAKPDRKYVITADQLPAHYSKSKVGHSYSVWLPWDEVGGIQKDITLLIRFEPKEGTAIIGEQKRQLLPGLPPPSKTASQASAPSSSVIQAAWATSMVNPTIKNNLTAPAEQAQDPNNMVQQASYQSPVPNGQIPATQNAQSLQRMSTETISIPSEMVMRTPAMMNPMPAPQPMMMNIQPTARPINNQPVASYQPVASNQPSRPQTAAVPMGAQPTIFSSSQPAIPAGATHVNGGYQNSPRLQVDSAPDQLQLQAGAPAQPNRDRGPWQQRPVVSQYAPGTQPELNYTNGFQAN